jgi:IrrE N-terminal-like domain
MVASDPRLEVLAADVRTADVEGRLDIDATADRLGVAVREAELGDYVEAVMLNGVIVLNRMSSSLGRRRFTFAHEVGHLLISRGRMPWVDRRSEECWADWFAHELVFPKRWLREKRWEQLCLFNDPAERRTIALHLACSAGANSAVLRVDDAVVCARCGDRKLFDDCECQRFRGDDHAMNLLPTLMDADYFQHQLHLFETDDEPFEALWRHLVVRLCDAQPSDAG